MRATICLTLLLATALCAAGCGEPVDLSAGLTVEVVSTGWVDTGMQSGQNKLVPSVTFTLKNISDQPLPVLQANVLFRRANEDTEWGSGFVNITDSAGLGPGETSKPLQVNSQLGYTGTEPRQQMLANSLFVDARVQLFAKYASTQWVKVGEYPVTRRLISQ